MPSIVAEGGPAKPLFRRGSNEVAFTERKLLPRHRLLSHMCRPDMQFRFIAIRADGSRFRDEFTHEGEPPPERAILEVTILRERLQVRVQSVHWPDRNGSPADVTMEEIGADGLTSISGISASQLSRAAAH